VKEIRRDSVQVVPENTSLESSQSEFHHNKKK